MPPQRLSSEKPPLAPGRYRRPLKRSGLLAVCLAGLLAAAIPAGGDGTVNVPLDHWAYELIERCEARGLLHGAGDGIRPLSRLELARLLLRVAAAAERDPAGLTRVDAERLERLRQELAPELAEAGGSPPAQTGRRIDLRGPGPLLSYRAPEGEILADLLFRQQTDLLTGRGRNESERIYRTRLGGSVRGRLHGLGYRLAFEQTREQGSRTYLTRDDVFDSRVEIPQLKGGLADYHHGLGYLTFGLPFGDVELGRDEVEWGPAPGDNLGLSRNAPAYDLVRLRGRLGAFKLVSLHAALRPCPDRPDSPLCGGQASPESYIVNQTTRTLDREKYLAAHRLEVAVAPWLDLGFQEEVVYGDRGPEWSYLNPVMLYWAAQSYLGDKDNVMMGVDLDLRPGHGTRVWLAYVVDDLKKLKIFSDDFANKFSLQTGLLWTDPLGLRDTDLRAEYVRIEPWIYTHKFPINTFSHFDSPLGHSLGPNSDRWRLGLTRRLSADLALNLTVGRTRHGYNELLTDGTVRNVGGDLFLGPRPGDQRDTKSFLDGVLATRTRLETAVRWQVWPNLALSGGMAVEWGSNVPLPPEWDPDVPLTRRSGFGDGREEHLTLDLRYGIF